MQKITIQSDFTVFETLNELDQEIQNLFNHAEKARQKAYAPYSNFLVGCALLLDNGEIITGSNQENASYPSGLCAERTAIYYAGAKYPEAKVVKMTIIAGTQFMQFFTRANTHNFMLSFWHRGPSHINYINRGDFFT